MIGELPAGSAIDNETLFVAEQQGQAVKITGREFRKLIENTSGTSGGNTGGGTGDNTGDGTGSGGGGDYTGGGYVEMTESIPVSQRKPNTLYGLKLKTYS